MINHIFLQLVVWMTCLSPLTGWAQTLDDFTERLDQELGDAQRQRDDALKQLRSDYLGALLRLESDLRKSGDLDGVEAARREIRRVETREDFHANVEDGGHGRISAMQKIIATQRKAIEGRQVERVYTLVTSVEQYVQNRAATLTRENNIAEARLWRDFGATIRERPMVAKVIRKIDHLEEMERRREAERNDPSNFHPALQGTPAQLIQSATKKFPEQAAVYVAGNEPQGEDKRLGTAKTPSAAGAGNTLLTSRVKLVEIESTLSEHRSSHSRGSTKLLSFVPRLEVTLLPGKSIRRSLVVFDLYKRGSGSDREIIETHKILLPELGSSEKIVVDSGPYAYESYKYRTRYGYRSESVSAEEFYGYIVTMFDQDGNLIFQRAAGNGLEDYARTAPPK
jgi:hypothetical protein